MVLTENSVLTELVEFRQPSLSLFGNMLTIILSVFSSARQVFQTRAALQAEILALRLQLLVLHCSSRGHRLSLSRADRFLSSSPRLSSQGIPTVLEVEESPSGRTTAVSLEVIDLIHRMSLANSGQGAPRIHGELLKLGFELSQATVPKYLVRHRRPPSQNWRTFLKNRIQSLVSADFFVVPTITFRLLFVLVILSRDPRRPIRLAVTATPTAEWTAPAIAGSFPLGQCGSASVAFFPTEGSSRP